VTQGKVSADVNGKNVYTWQGNFAASRLHRLPGQSSESLQLGGTDGAEFIFENVILEPLAESKDSESG